MRTFSTSFAQYREGAPICEGRHALIKKYNRRLLALAKAVYEKATHNETLTHTKIFCKSPMRYVMRKHFALFGDTCWDLVFWLEHQKMLKDVASNPVKKSLVFGVMQLLETHILNEDISLAYSVGTEDFSTSQIYLNLEGRVVAYTTLN